LTTKLRCRMEARWFSQPSALDGADSTYTAVERPTLRYRMEGADRLAGCLLDGSARAPRWWRTHRFVAELKGFSNRLAAYRPDGNSFAHACAHPRFFAE